MKELRQVKRSRKRASLFLLERTMMEKIKERTGSVARKKKSILVGKDFVVAY